MKISIITVNYNSGEAPSALTANSVIKQNILFEWVVVDGGSSDRSVEILKGALRPGDKFITEPDKGIADAFNKGLNLATSESVIFMNVGDTFAGPDALSQLFDKWDRQKYRWITGGAEVIDGNDRVLFRRLPLQPKDPFTLVIKGCRIFHQATLTDRQMLIDAGGFDIAYRYAMDCHLWLQLIKGGYHPQVEPVLVCRYRNDGVSGNTLGRLVEDRRSRAALGLSNAWIVDARLWVIAWVKSILRRHCGTWAFRLKERFGW